MKKRAQRIRNIATFALLCSAVLSQSAAAQMSDKPWGFAPQNRASIAALIQSVEDQNTGSSAVVSGSAGATTLVCGSDGSSAAKGTASCIILNNSTGSVLLDQDSTGDQTATNTETTNVDETINASADDVLAVLNGE